MSVGGALAIFKRIINRFKSLIKVIKHILQIYERIGWDDRVGGTYLAIAGDKELVVRVDFKNAGVVGIETKENKSFN